MEFRKGMFFRVVMLMSTLILPMIKVHSPPKSGFLTDSPQKWTDIIGQALKRLNPVLNSSKGLGANKVEVVPDGDSSTTLRSPRLAPKVNGLEFYVGKCLI